MSQKRSLVHEIYKNYTPEVNVKKIIQILLEYVPPEDLDHLQSIVLTNTAALSRRKKRQRSSSGAHISYILGRCHQRWKGQPAYIEIFVDNILSDASLYDLRIPMLRNWMFAKVLYHEIGHHVQVISNSILVKKEEVFADQYAARLNKYFLRQRYGYLRRFLLPLIKICLGFIRIIDLVKKRLVRKKYEILGI